MLALADGFANISEIMSLGYFSDIPHLDKSVLCQVQAMGIQYFEIATFLWTAIIAVHLYCSAVAGFSSERAASFFPVYLAVGWGLPLVPVIVVGVLKGFGNSSDGVAIAWCWILGNFGIARIGFYYGPMTLLWIFNAVLYVLISRKAFLTHSTAFKRVVIRLTLYILAALIANTPALINRIQNIIQPHNPIFALFLLHSIFNPLQGFGHAIVYSSSAQLRSEYAALFSRIFCKCFNKRYQVIIDEDAIGVKDLEEEAYEEYRRTTYASQTQAYMSSEHSSLVRNSPQPQAIDFTNRKALHLNSELHDGTTNSPASSYQYGSSLYGASTSNASSSNMSRSYPTSSRSNQSHNY